MAGTTNPYGSPPGSKPKEEEPPAPAPASTPTSRSAQTVYGRDLHLNRSVLGLDRPDLPVPAPVPAPIAQPEPTLEPGATVVGHTGKSRIPAIARAYGRWNTEGDFVSDGEVEWPMDGDTLLVPRESYLKPVLIVIGTALASFVLILGTVRLIKNLRGKPASVAVQAAAAPVAAPPPAPAPVTPAPPPPAVVHAAPAPLPAQPQVRPVAVRRKPSPPRAATPVAARPPAAPVHDPDSPLPLAF